MPVCYCIRQKHLGRIEPAVVELMSLFSVQFSFWYYQWWQFPTGGLFVTNASIVKTAEKRRETYNAIVKGWKALFLIRLLSLKNFILSIRGNTSAWASGKRDGISELRIRDWHTKRNIQFVAILNRGFQCSALDCFTLSTVLSFFFSPLQLQFGEL